MVHRLALFGSSRAVDAAVVTAAACLSLYIWLRPALGEPSRPRRHITSRARESARSTSSKGALPYPPDVFPGGRDVETEYGTIKVFEWGPEDGEKVLLMHGIGTPCVALGDMAKEFVERGCRVMLFDFFGRGYSDAPVDVPYDERLYTTQILLVLASSPLPWTGSSVFHLLGYSLGGALAASFAAYHPSLVRSLTLICPGGLVRPSHVSFKSRLLYTQGILPSWLVTALARRRLEPRRGASADVPEGEDADVDFDEVPVSVESRTGVRVGDVVKWQLAENDGFVGAYMSTIRNAPIYGQHEKVWVRLSDELARRRGPERDIPAGLEGGRICLILAEKDPIVVKEEWIEDSRAVLGQDGVDVHVVGGGHEIAISKGREVADVAMTAWNRQERTIKIDDQSFIAL
ncbi:alpha/beta hydrolase [Purpureocillium lilacinum]|uniref:Alpha/beta hydrolase n=1 Tax=Purpureocillium lilacinum TaxID=33203 RepID=A0A179HR18_PURLI|nr:alpha/beta hydrolase [Purpureocillium lilacinum]OAQ92001.1 alpha/beta hydrolase [Purpureocillium lilacinum]